MLSLRYILVVGGLIGLSECQNIQVDVPKTEEVLELDVLRVNCTIAEDIEVTYRWVKEDDPSFVIQDQVLEIFDIRREHAGRYRCEVISIPDTNRRGENTTNVIVYFMPRWENQRLEKFSADIGESVSLECHTISKPDPNFYWQLNGVNLTSGSEFEISSMGNSSTLTVRSVSQQHYNTYQCVGHNIAGTNRFPLELLPPGIPDAPQLCELTNTNATNVTISCLPGYLGGEPLDFSVYKSAPNIEKEHVRSEHEMAGRMADILVMDLVPNSNYTIHVHQANEHGESSESLGLLVTTEDGPPQPPGDNNQLIIIIVACSAGAFLICIIILIVAVVRCRKQGTKKQPRFDNPKDANNYVMESAQQQGQQEDAGRLNRKNSWGSFKRSKKVKPPPMTMNNVAQKNQGYMMSSNQSLERTPQMIAYETAPTLPRDRPPYTLSLSHNPGESSDSVTYDNAAYINNDLETSFQAYPAGGMPGPSTQRTPSIDGSNYSAHGSTVSDAQVELRRRMADPLERAQRLSDGQPSLAGMGALSMLPDPTRGSIHPPRTPAASTPTSQRSVTDLTSKMAPPAFQPERVPQVPWEFRRDKLYIRTKLGEGSFGEVWRARAEGICGRQGKLVVAVKMLKDYATPEEKRALFKELDVMKKLQPHPNIIQLLGCCTQSEPICIIMEFASQGNLENLLRKQRSSFAPNNLNVDESNRNQSSNLTYKDLVNFCLNVCTGMEYIASKQLLHRDLAARNVLVDENLICKVCDFGSARDVTEMRQYESQTQRRLPLRWMAPESIFQCEYSVQSDVWAFGVLCWEIVTLGSSPYPGMSGPDVMNFVQKGCRMAKPKHTSDSMYALMKDCWHQFPPRRPHFSLLRHRLAAILDEPNVSVYVDQMADDIYDILPAQPGEKC